MNNLLGKLIYWGITKTLRMPVFSLLKEFEQSEKLSLDELHRIEFVKTLTLLEYAIHNSPYYKKIFQDLGAEMEDIKSFDDFKHIPILTKSIMREQGTEILSALGSNDLTIAKTSGSTGIPLKLYKNKEAVASTYAAMYRGHRWHGVDVGANEARLWGVPIDHWAKVKSRGKDFLLNRFRQKNLETSKQAFEAYYQSLLKYRPCYLMGYPSFIHSFAISAKEQGWDCLKLGLKFVKYTAEILPEYQKQCIEDVFGCRCVSEYGAAETGIIAFECPHGNSHLMSESVFVEFVEIEDKECNKSNKKFKLLVTNFYNRAFPVIRYEIGDLAKPVDGVCSCGRTLPLISKIEGRVSDEVIGVDGKRFHSSTFSYILKDCIGAGLGAREVRFIQNKPGEIEAQICCRSKDIVAFSRKLKESAINVFGNSIVMTASRFTSLSPDASGKFRYFISNLQTPKVDYNIVKKEA